MFPLTNRKLVHDIHWHIAHGEGIGADYEAIYVNLMAPFDGVVTKPYWSDYGTGGIWLRLTRPNGDYIEFAHLSKRIKLGVVKAGYVIGITGSTGLWCYGPHLHIQAFVNGKRVDPEQYYWISTEAETIEQTIARLFKDSWGRDAFTGEISVFVNRLNKKNIKVTELASKIQYTADHRNELEKQNVGKGDKWWDSEKKKWNK
jgi:hypothetical protein